MAGIERGRTGHGMRGAELRELFWSDGVWVGLGWGRVGLGLKISQFSEPGRRLWHFAVAGWRSQRHKHGLSLSLRVEKSMRVPVVSLT
jgi:hypothetical protein